jgi:hypothetical protein
VSMTAIAAERPSRLLPFSDPSRGRRFVKVGAWLAGTALVVLILNVLGVDVRGWLSDLWDALSDISLEYLLAGWAVQTVQTTFIALAWYFILRAGFPRAPVPSLQVLAAYAAGVAPNGFSARETSAPSSCCSCSWR